jgi:hypothetical protein
MRLPIDFSKILDIEKSPVVSALVEVVEQQSAAKNQFTNLTEWNAHLEDLKIENHRHVKIATEGALIGSLLHHGLPRSLVIVSDDAGQFNVLIHALCWIHAERALNKLIAPNEEKRRILEPEIRFGTFTRISRHTKHPRTQLNKSAFR